MANHSHQARKRFGQHFLVDRQIIASIADQVLLRRGSRGPVVDSIEPTWVEIGPGRAALTVPLIERLQNLKPPAQLHAIEIDRDLVASLGRRFKQDHLVVHQADALGFDFAQLPGPLVVAGNLPYNISTPLLIRLLAVRERVLHQVFMLQREVVLRMVGEPGTKDYGRLSVMLQAHYAMSLVLDVPAHCFDPPPRVESAVVRMEPLNSGLQDTDVLEELLQVAFAQRRKMLRAHLFVWLSEQGITDPGLPAQARAEDIPVDQWVALANRLATYRQ